MSAHLGKHDKMRGLLPLSRTNFHVLNVYEPLKFDCIWDNYNYIYKLKSIFLSQ